MEATNKTLINLLATPEERGEVYDPETGLPYVMFTRSHKAREADNQRERVQAESPKTPSDIPTPQSDASNLPLSQQAPKM
jgi:hypothetical protein